MNSWSEGALDAYGCVSTGPALLGGGAAECPIPVGVILRPFSASLDAHATGVPHEACGACGAFRSRFSRTSSSAASDGRSAAIASWRCCFCGALNERVAAAPPAEPPAAPADGAAEADGAADGDLDLQAETIRAARGPPPPPPRRAVVRVVDEHLSPEKLSLLGPLAARCFEHLAAACGDDLLVGLISFGAAVSLHRLAEARGVQAADAFSGARYAPLAARVQHGDHLSPLRGPVLRNLRLALQSLAARRRCAAGRATGIAVRHALELLRHSNCDAAQVVLLTSGPPGAGAGAGGAAEAEAVADACAAAWERRSVALDAVVSECREAAPARPLLERWCAASGGAVYGVECQDVRAPSSGPMEGVLDPPGDFEALLEALLRDRLLRRAHVRPRCGAVLEVFASRGLRVARVVAHSAAMHGGPAPEGWDAAAFRGGLSGRCEERDRPWPFGVFRLRFERPCEAAAHAVLVAPAAPAAPAGGDAEAFLQVVARARAGDGGAALRVITKRFRVVDSRAAFAAALNGDAAVALQTKASALDVPLEAPAAADLDDAFAGGGEAVAPDEAWRRCCEDGDGGALLRPQRSAMVEQQAKALRAAAWLLEALREGAGEDAGAAERRLARSCAMLYALRCSRQLAKLQANADDLLALRSYLKASDVRDTLLAARPLLHRRAGGAWEAAAAQATALRSGGAAVLEAHDALFAWAGEGCAEAEARDALRWARERQRRARRVPPPALVFVGSGSNLVRHLAGRTVASYDLGADEVATLCRGEARAEGEAPVDPPVAMQLRQSGYGDGDGGGTYKDFAKAVRQRASGAAAAAAAGDGGVRGLTRRMSRWMGVKGR